MASSRTMELRCSFHGQYHAKYQRNNKRCGFKNLRCFPYCGPDGAHHEQGFCGVPITVDITVQQQKDAGGFSTDKLRAWGEFVLRDAEPRFPIGSTFSKRDIFPLLRTDVERSNPLFESSTDSTTTEIVSGDERKQTFRFHSHKMGYHYGWVGNKHSVSSNVSALFIRY
jgi:hypothetical protein